MTITEEERKLTLAFLKYLLDNYPLDAEDAWFDELHKLIKLYSN